jgi:CubicO group peptidase (beta-lactamase class C family)
MAALTEALGDLAEVLQGSIASKKLPGASMAVLLDGALVEASAGVLNVRTGVETTTDTLFQIGSITKVYTATLVMQLVDAGLVQLDAPVRTHLPEFAVADAAATEAITVRHLLTHTSGFDGGDHFFDGGRGDDTMARYVASLAELSQISAPGAMWSYNNAGFGVLGRIVEVVTGQVWDDALRDRLLRPAGLGSTVSLPEDALLFRTAAGHQAGDDGNPELVARWGLNRSSGPAGLICATAADVVGFARVHLEDGRGVLSPASVKAMQQEQIGFPGETEAACGLGWIIRDLVGVRTIGHNGGTLGQLAFLSAVPDRGFAIALLTNGPTGAAVWQEVVEHVTSRLGLPSHKATLPKPPSEVPDLDLTKYVGRYERKAVHSTVSLDDDHLTLGVEYVGIEYDLKPPPAVPIVPVDAQTFVALGPDGEPAMSMQFLDFDDDGRPQLFFAARLAKRAS